MFCKKGVLRNFAKFTGKPRCQSLFFNNVAGLSLRCFPVNFAKFVRTPFLTEHLWRVLLLISYLHSFYNSLEENSIQTVDMSLWQFKIKKLRQSIFEKNYFPWPFFLKKNYNFATSNVSDAAVRKFSTK